MKKIKNPERAEQIRRGLPGAGTPLFDAPKILELATDTRNKAYRELRTQLGEVQKIVLNTIERRGPLSNNEIAHELKWEINRVTGRTMELRKRGIVHQAGKRPCTITGTLVKIWNVRRDE